MGQSSNDAAMKVAQTMLRGEIGALSMVQSSNVVAVMDAQIKLRMEECA